MGQLEVKIGSKRTPEATRETSKPTDFIDIFYLSLKIFE